MSKRMRWTPLDAGLPIWASQVCRTQYQQPLVHDVRLAAKLMQYWRVECVEIPARCALCAQFALRGRRCVRDMPETCRYAIRDLLVTGRP